MTDARLVSYAPPHPALRVLGSVLATVGIASVVVAAATGEAWSVVLIVAVFCAIPVAAGLWMALVGVRIRLTDHEIQVSYFPLTVRVPRAEVTEITPRDDRSGFGFGYGYRWEGRGVRAIRVGGPMVTIVHTQGRVSATVDDALRVQRELSR